MGRGRRAGMDARTVGGRWAAGCALAIAVGLGPGACARLPQVAVPGAGDEGIRTLVADRVWIDTGDDVARGSLRAFLSDGTLVMTSCVEVYRLAAWRWVDGATLVWEEDGRPIRAEIALAERNEMVLVIDPGGENISRHYRAARAPVVCPDIR